MNSFIESLSRQENLSCDLQKELFSLGDQAIKDKILMRKTLCRDLAKQINSSRDLNSYLKGSNANLDTIDFKMKRFIDQESLAIISNYKKISPYFLNKLKVNANYEICYNILSNNSLSRSDRDFFLLHFIKIESKNLVSGSYGRILSEKIFSNDIDRDFKTLLRADLYRHPSIMIQALENYPRSLECQNQAYKYIQALTMNLLTELRKDYGKLLEIYLANPFIETSKKNSLSKSLVHKNLFPNIIESFNSNNISDISILRRRKIERQEFVQLLDSLLEYSNTYPKILQSLNQSEVKNFLSFFAKYPEEDMRDKVFRLLDRFDRHFINININNFHKEKKYQVLLSILTIVKKNYEINFLYDKNFQRFLRNLTFPIKDIDVLLQLKAKEQFFYISRISNIRDFYSNNYLTSVVHNYLIKKDVSIKFTTSLINEYEGSINQFVHLYRNI